MSLLIINRREIGINKFLIYALLMFCLLYPTIFKDCLYAITFSRAKGKVTSFIVTENKTGKRNTKYFPVAEFQVNDTIYTSIGSHYEHQNVYLHDSVSIIYDPKNPTKSYHFSFNGFWSPELVYVLPFSLLLTLMFFLDSIPNYFTLRAKKNIQ